MIKGCNICLKNNLKIDFKQNVNLKATCLINKVTKNISQNQMNYVKSKKLNSKDYLGLMKVLKLMNLVVASVLFLIKINS